MHMVIPSVARQANRKDRTYDTRREGYRAVCAVCAAACSGSDTGAASGKRDSREPWASDWRVGDLLHSAPGCPVEQVHPAQSPGSPVSMTPCDADFCSVQRRSCSPDLPLAANEHAVKFETEY